MPLALKSITYSCRNFYYKLTGSGQPVISIYTYVLPAINLGTGQFGVSSHCSYIFYQFFPNNFTTFTTINIVYQQFS